MSEELLAAFLSDFKGYDIGGATTLLLEHDYIKYSDTTMLEDEFSITRANFYTVLKPFTYQDRTLTITDTWSTEAKHWHPCDD